MYDLDRHPYLEAFIDPESGVKSYILKEKVGELQQNFYFTESGYTTSGKYLWFKYMNWPSSFCTIAVLSLDPDDPFIRTFPAATLSSTCIPVIPGTDDILFQVGPSAYRMDVEGNITKVFEVGQDILKGRTLQRISTHLSFSADAKLVLLDMVIANQSYVGTYNWDTGEIKVIHKFMRHYNHGMFCPTDPELFLIDQDWQSDPNSGERFSYDLRMWLMDVNGTRLEPVLPTNWAFHNDSIICHDFWSKDGYVCYPDLMENVYEYDLKTKKATAVWNHSICHAHTLDRKYWVGDDSPYKWDRKLCQTVFFDRASGKEIDIFSGMPPHKYTAATGYHLDPHPCFSDDGKYIFSMVTYKNRGVDLAITPVEPLIKLCKEKGLQVNEPWTEE